MNRDPFSSFKDPDLDLEYIKALAEREVANEKIMTIEDERQKRWFAKNVLRVVNNPRQNRLLG